MRSQIIAICSAALILGCVAPDAYAQSSPEPESASELPLFAIEITIGPNWNPEKPPQEQALFSEHSANLRRMREAGNLVFGARYSDKGLVVVAAPTLSEAKAMMEADPSIAAGTFVYEVYPFNVFYSGSVEARPHR